jgi:hypothetical protein
MLVKLLGDMYLMWFRTYLVSYTPAEIKLATLTNYQSEVSKRRFV